jgi:hypothetical protein
MPRVEGAGALRVSGLYLALLERERRQQARADRHRTSRADGHPLMRRDRRLLDTLEAGKPAVVAAQKLGGWGVPKVPLTREQRQRGNRFKVSPDDTVRPAGDDGGIRIRAE